MDHAVITSIMIDALTKKIAEILRILLKEIDTNQSMSFYGVDSLVALEVRHWITRELKANVALLDILTAVSIKTFADQIAQTSKFVGGTTS